MSLKDRIIPCLDVKDGRVVKGVNFVDLVDAGDPVEAAAAYDAAGADELCFLDITATHENRDIIFDVVVRTAERCFMPLTVGGGVRTVEDIGKLLRGRRRQGVDQHRRREQPRSSSRRRPRSSAPSASSSPSTPRRCRGEGEPIRWEIFTHGGRKPTGIDAVAVCQGGRGARRRRDPAHLDGPRRHQGRLRPRADARHLRRGDRAGHRLGRRRHARSSGRGREKGHASAVLAASIFHFGTHTIGEAKRHMAEAGIAVRPAG